MKVLNFELFNEIEGEAKASPRHRMHHDLRTQANECRTTDLGINGNWESGRRGFWESGNEGDADSGNQGTTEWKDTSQRMLNVMKKDTVIPIHRHSETSETVIILRGSGDEVTYDSEGKELERVTLVYGSDCAAVQVPRNVYHTFIPHEDGTVIFEAKDRAYDPEKTEEMLVTHS